MAAKIPDIYQENIYEESLLGMPEHYKVLQHFLDIDEVCVPNWENMPKNEREEFIREVILGEFPEKREEIERCIRHLWKMADDIDEIHKKCTLANIAVCSVSASYGILTILGMTLAPFTAGGSLILTTTGLGLGAVAAATGLSATLYESASTSKETKKAQMLMDINGEKFRMVNCPRKTNLEKNNQNVAPELANAAFRMYTAAKKIKENVKTLKYAQANTGLKGLARRVIEAEKAICGKIWGTKPVEKAFTGTSLAMSKAARLVGAATTGAFVLVDAYNIAQDAKHLQEGAKAEAAAEIREKARKLEEELQKLIKLFEAVQMDHYLQQWRRDSNTRARELSECTPGRATKEQRGIRRPLDGKPSLMALDNQVEGRDNLRAKEMSEHTSYSIRNRWEGTSSPPDVVKDNKGRRCSFPKRPLLTSRWEAIDGR